MTLHELFQRCTSVFDRLRKLPNAPAKTESVVTIGAGVVVVGFIRNAAVLEIRGELETETLSVQRLIVHPGGLVNATGLVAARTIELGGRIVADSIQALDLLTVTETGALAATTTVASCIIIREGALLNSYVKGGPETRSDEPAPSLPGSTLAPA